MREFSITRRNAPAVLIVWAFFAFHFIGIIKVVGQIPFTHAALIIIPPMILELFLIFSVGYVIMGLPAEMSTRRQWGTVIITALLVQALFLSVLFFNCRVWDSIHKGLNLLATAERLEVRMLAGGMSWLYTLLIIVFSFLQRNIRLTRNAESRAASQTIAAYRAELKSIKTTINPHFLFNALNVLGTLTIQSPRLAREVSFKLSEFMRYSLRVVEKDFTTVGEELVHITNYLAIEKIRFGDRLDYRFTVEDGLAQFPIPVLTLLPVVENAVKHGIQGCAEGGTVQVNIKRQNPVIRIEVINPVESRPRTLIGEGMGLRTLKRQLAAHYGTDASLRAVHREGIFTVTIKIPEREGAGHEGQQVDGDHRR